MTASVLQLLARIWSELLRVVAGQQTLKAGFDRSWEYLTGLDLETRLATIEADLVGLNNLLLDSVYGLPQIRQALDLINPGSEQTLQAILDAIAALPAGSDLPAASAITTDVWGWQEYGAGEPTAAQALWATHWRTFRASQYAAPPLARNPLFSAGPMWGAGGPAESIPPPTPDWAAILATDTRLSWLQRTEETYQWFADEATGEPYAGTGVPAAVGPLYQVKLRPLFSEAQFQSWKVKAANGPPIWPGEAGVTFSEPTVLTESAVVAGPMDGVLLTVDSGPGGSSQWGVGDFHSYFRGGYLIFLDAAGHADVTQYIGPADNVFVPKAMTTAAGVVILLNKVSQVTVAPWVLA